ncbi:EspA/EspE family type VII secretion system effector [Mycobacterium sp. URHB0044]|uniref:EspA/EspE family type VII secretion system effector n=1 Tax=Mycobacterium sp. URHB0044 TaxID=1380386 RepID=UPI00049202F2|nr:EspA/EspE family type VII secretion system effector [Mycobacterium sp. URHB0044]
MGLLGKLESFGKAVWATGKAVVGGAGAKESLRAADSVILEGGQLVIAGMKLTTGVGTPEDGERFGQAGVRGLDAIATLGSAQPSPSWSGEGAQSYSARNVEQMARIENMTTVDHDVHRVLAAEAFQVGMHRGRLDDWYNWLADMGLVTSALGLVPGVGRSLKAAADAQAVLVAVGSSSIELYQLSSEVDANAAALQQLADRYGDAAPSANIAKTPPDRNPPPPSDEDVPDETPEEEHPEEAPAPAVDEKLDAPTGFVAPGGGPGASGANSGGGPPASGGAPAAPPTAIPEAAPVAEFETPSSGPAPAAMGASPAAAPPPMSAGAAPMAPAPGIPMALIKEAVRAALQEEAEKRDAEKRDEDEPDEEEEDETKDEDGDGVPDEEARPEEAKSGEAGTDGERPPVDVDVARLGRPGTVTFAGENPIGPPPTPTP